MHVLMGPGRYEDDGNAGAETKEVDLSSGPEERHAP